MATTKPPPENGQFAQVRFRQCAVADGYRMFLSSENFTEYAYTINMKLGLLVTGGKLPEQVERHLVRLVNFGVSVRI